MYQDYEPMEDPVMTIDQQFIEYIVKALVGDPDAVKVERRIDEKGVLLELTVAADDLGRVIGKRGATAQSLRSLLRALGTKNDARYNLKIIDVDRPDGGYSAPAQGATDDDFGTASDFPVQNPTDDTVDKESNLAKDTRKELAELDDLDI